jgi:hypothetical protein
VGVVVCMRQVCGGSLGVVCVVPALLTLLTPCYQRALFLVCVVGDRVSVCLCVRGRGAVGVGSPVGDGGWVGMTAAQRSAEDNAATALLERCADITRRVHTKTEYMEVRCSTVVCGVPLLPCYLLPRRAARQAG